jgi:hypothetical protein
MGISLSERDNYGGRTSKNNGKPCAVIPNQKPGKEVKAAFKAVKTPGDSSCVRKSGGLSKRRAHAKNGQSEDLHHAFKTENGGFRGNSKIFGAMCAHP